jgi:hypothetical protein
MKKADDGVAVEVVVVAEVREIAEVGEAAKSITPAPDTAPPPGGTANPASAAPAAASIGGSAASVGGMGDLSGAPSARVLFWADRVALSVPALSASQLEAATVPTEEVREWLPVWL